MQLSKREGREEGREGRGEEMAVSAPHPHPLAGEAGGRILTSGTALPVQLVVPEVAGSASNPCPVTYQQPRSGDLSEGQAAKGTVSNSGECARS